MFWDTVSFTSLWKRKWPILGSLVALASFQNCGEGFKLTPAATSTEVSSSSPSSPNAAPPPPPVAPQAQIPQIVNGLYNNCLLASGSVKCWGQYIPGNQASQNNMTQAPVFVGPRGGIIKQFDSSEGHSCALVTMGGQDRVFCWGVNYLGQLGLPTNIEFSLEPVEIVALRGAKAVAVEFGVTCAISDQNTVKCLGLNRQIVDSLQAVDIPGLTNITQISLGFKHACALSTSGTVKCWGENNFGQLGNNSLVDSARPVDVVGLSNVKQVAVFSFSTCALHLNGTVSCWGGNAVGQLGNGNQTNSRTPINVVGVTNATLIGQGRSIGTCIINTTGRVLCWGSHARGQAGSNAADFSSVPVEIPGIADASSIDTGGGSTCVHTRANRTFCWGLNNIGQLGRITAEDYITQPLEVMVSF